MNSLLVNINKHCTSPKMSLQLFDAFVSSTILYGCEILKTGQSGKVTCKVL